MQSPLREHAAQIFRAALAAADPESAVERVLRGRSEIQKANKVWVLGAGKAGATMARAAERVLGDQIAGGLVNTKYGHAVPLDRIELIECGHPVPDEAGVAGARRIAAIARQAQRGDLVICLVSGGASALLPAPAEGVTLAEKQETTKLLLASGATIHEINAVRKHLSSLKGGQLARLAAPANVLALLLSDVIGDDLDVIGSGPTAPDSSTYESARAVLEKYGIAERVPSSVRARLWGDSTETPKPGDPLFRRVRNIVIGSNRLAVNAAAAEGRRLGYRTLVLSTFVQGEARVVAGVYAAIAREIAAAKRPVKRPACVISGGETTVTIRGQGLGGRNQEFALAAGIAIAGLPETLVFSAGTDGTDGPTDAAGAQADGETVSRGLGMNLIAEQFLAHNDSYRFFEKLEDLVKTGPTGTNVMDIHLLLMG